MATTLVIPMDFTGVQPPRSLGVLEAGLHTGTITNFAYYEDSGRLYAYLQTGDVFHRDSFNTSGKGLTFLLGFLASAGANVEKLAGNKADVPFHELEGKMTYFHYTPPTLDVAGNPVDGSYASYRFMGKAEYEKKVSRMGGAAPAQGGEANGTPSATAPAAGGSQGNFDFLTQ